MKKLLMMLAAGLIGCPLFGALSDGLVAHYKFDGNADDSSGNGNNGTVHGVTLTTDRFGNANSAYSFDGDDWISVAHADSLNPDALTLSVWMKPSDWYNGHIPILCKSNESWREGSYRSQIDNHGDTVAFMLRGSASADNCLELGKWQLITITVDSQCMCVYRNGLLVAKDDTPDGVQKKSDDIGIGRNIVGATEYFKGVMDDFRIYNRALSATEVKLLYEGPSDSGLVAWYKFDGSLSDAGGNGYALSGEGVAYGVDRNQGSSAALSCSGATELRPSKTLEVDETFTVACWVKAGKDTAVYSEDGRMCRTCYDEGNVVLAPGFSQKYPDDGAGVGFSVGKNGIAVYEHAGVYLPVVLMYEANIGDGWNHVVVQVENNGAPKVYLNGALVRTGVQGAKPKRSVVIMADGAHALCGGGYGHFSGSIDDLRIYNRALAATEVKSLYEGGGGTQSGGGLVHRWSFNGNLTDSVGGQTAKIVGSVTTDGSQYTLAGGSRGSSYIDLGSDILPRNGSGVTIELWATQRSEKFWGRIWDIGNSTSDEMFMAWTDQRNVNKDGFQVRGVTSSDVSAFAPYVLGTEYHISTVFEPQGDGSWKIRFYKKNVATGATIASYELDSEGKSWTLQNQGQICCWLGHSIFTQDDDANASYNEVRVWNRALTEAELTANALLGPDVLPGDSSDPEIPICTITFDANGGTPTPAAITRKEGEVYGTLPTVTKSGFTFDGWYTSASGGMKVTSENTATGNVTLYAHWVQNAIYYTMTFNVNGGSCSTSSKQYESGAMLGALPTAKRSGYTFDGWYTAANGGTRVGGSTIVTENIVLYAHWRVPPASNVKMISFRQRYPWNGLVDVDCEVSIGEDSGYKVGLEVVDDEAGTNLAVKTLWVVGGEETNKYVSVRSGVQRLVWNADADLSDGFKCKTGRARLRLAKQVEFDAAGGQCDVGSKTFILGEPYGALPIPTRSGYQFVGWCAAAYDGARIDAESIADPVISVLTAKWEVR